MLNLEQDGRNLWRLTKQLNDDKDQAKGHVTLEEDGEMLTGRQAANGFAHNYKDVSDIPVNREQQREARREQRERKTYRETPCHINQRLTLHGLKTVLKKLEKKHKKSQGPDGITNEMLFHLGPTATSKLLEFYNHSWNQGQLPQIWRGNYDPHSQKREGP